MRVSLLCALLLCASPCLAMSDAWALPNFSDRLSIVVKNPTDREMDRVVVLDTIAVRRLAPAFPGTLAIAVDGSSPVQYLPSQADGPDEFALEVKLHAHEEKTVYLYFSLTLRDDLPTPKRVHASHRYGYNQSTAAIESEHIGYRTYGGFFFDVQAHAPAESGLFNAWLGYTRTSAPPREGQDVIHLGDTLGLGGLFLRTGTDVYRPPLNTPDYTHHPAKAEEPVYRVLSTGPIRAVVEATVAHWTIGDDVVDLRARYEMRAGEHLVRCHWWLVPVHLSRTYEVGAGVRDLPGSQHIGEKELVITRGTQDPKGGEFALGLSFATNEAHRAGTLQTKEGGNQIVVFAKPLRAAEAASGTYEFAAGWSGSGPGDVVSLLKAALEERVEPQVRVLRHEINPDPKRLEGEPI